MALTAGTTDATDAQRSASTRARWTLSRALGVVAVAGVVAYALLSLAFVVWGRLNHDEGWYLYAGRLVWQGELPFSDFGFTQTPLVPYVYGLSQLVEPNLYLGRLVSLVFGTAAVALCVRVAWREARRGAAAAVAVLCVAFPTGAYNLTLTKTYALVAFFLAVILAALTSPRRPAMTFPVATAAATGLTLTRTSGIVLTVLVVVYAVARAPDRATRRNAAAPPAVGALLMGTLVLLDLDAARFGLWTFHQQRWGDASTGTRIDTILTDRVPEWAGDYWAYVLLVAAALVAVIVSRDVRRYVQSRPVYLMMTVGIVAYLGVQLMAGQWAPIEYAAPVVPALVTMATVLVVRGCLGPSGTTPAFRGAPFLVGGAVLAIALITVFHPSADGYLVGRSDPGSVDAANRVAAYLRDHTGPSDRILALWGQPATTAADRELVHDVTFGIFSFEDLGTRVAKELHYVNRERLVRLLESRAPDAIVLTDIDRERFGFRGAMSDKRSDPAPILDALDSIYRKVHSDTGWGTDGPIAVDVYVRDGDRYARRP